MQAISAAHSCPPERTGSEHSAQETVPWMRRTLRSGCAALSGLHSRCSTYPHGSSTAAVLPVALRTQHGRATAVPAFSLPLRYAVGCWYSTVLPLYAHWMLSVQRPHRYWTGYPVSCSVRLAASLHSLLLRFCLRRRYRRLLQRHTPHAPYAAFQRNLLPYLPPLRSVRFVIVKHTL